MKTTFDKERWISTLPDDPFIAPVPVMFGGSSKELTPEERDFYKKAGISAEMQSQIAAKLADLGAKGFGYGEGELQAAQGKRTASDKVLQDLMNGDRSFVDDTYKPQFDRARESTVRNFNDVGNVLDETYSKRGLYGGGQHRGDFRRVVSNSLGSQLSDQATGFATDIAHAKEAERSSALSAILQGIGGDFNLSTTLMGQGQSGYGGASDAYKGAGSTYNSALNTSVNRPQRPSPFEQVTGFLGKIWPNVNINRGS